MMENKVKRLVTDSLLATIALTIFVVELQIPALTPIPGIKLGLSNIMTLVAMYLYGPLDGFFVLIVRILLGCMFSGQVMSLMYSLAGGLLSFLVLIIMRRLVTIKQIFVMSVFSALFHNLGQILVAILITKTVAVLYYLPFMEIAAIITGLFTGLTAQIVIKRLKSINWRE